MTTLRELFHRLVNRDTNDNTFIITVIPAENPDPLPTYEEVHNYT